VKTVESAGATDPARGFAGGGGSSAVQAFVEIANRLGVEVSLNQLRQRFSLRDEVVATELLLAMASELGLEGRAVHMRFAELPRSIVVRIKRSRLIG